MTPVDALDAPATASTPSALAAAAVHLAHVASPSGPVSAFALPLFDDDRAHPLAGQARRGVAHGGRPRRVHGEAPGGGARRLAEDERHVLADALDAGVDARRTKTSRRLRDVLHGEMR